MTRKSLKNKRSLRKKTSRRKATKSRNYSKRVHTRKNKKKLSRKNKKNLSTRKRSKSYRRKTINKKIRGGGDSEPPGDAGGTPPIGNAGGTPPTVLLDESLKEEFYKAVERDSVGPAALTENTLNYVSKSLKDESATSRLARTASKIGRTASGAAKSTVEEIIRVLGMRDQGEKFPHTIGTETILPGCEPGVVIPPQNRQKVNIRVEIIVYGDQIEDISKVSFLEKNISRTGDKSVCKSIAKWRDDIILSFDDEEWDTSVQELLGNKIKKLVDKHNFLEVTSAPGTSATTRTLRDKYHKIDYYHQYASEENKMVRYMPTGGYDMSEDDTIQTMVCRVGGVHGLSIRVTVEKFKFDEISLFTQGALLSLIHI